MKEKNGENKRYNIEQQIANNRDDIQNPNGWKIKIRVQPNNSNNDHNNSIHKTNASISIKYKTEKKTDSEEKQWKDNSLNNEISILKNFIQSHNEKVNKSLRFIASHKDDMSLFINNFNFHKNKNSDIDKIQSKKNQPSIYNTHTNINKKVVTMEKVKPSEIKIKSIKNQEKHNEIYKNFYNPRHLVYSSNYDISCLIDLNSGSNVSKYQNRKGSQNSHLKRYSETLFNNKWHSIIQSNYSLSNYSKGVNLYESNKNKYTRTSLNNNKDFSLKNKGSNHPKHNLEINPVTCKNPNDIMNRSSIKKNKFKELNPSVNCESKVEKNYNSNQDLYQNSNPFSKHIINIVINLINTFIYLISKKSYEEQDINQIYKLCQIFNLNIKKGNINNQFFHNKDALFDIKEHLLLNIYTLLNSENKVKENQLIRKSIFFKACVLDGNNPMIVRSILKQR